VEPTSRTLRVGLIVGVIAYVSVAAFYDPSIPGLPMQLDW